MYFGNEVLGFNCENDDNTLFEIKFHYLNNSNIQRILDFLKTIDSESTIYRYHIYSDCYDTYGGFDKSYLWQNIDIATIMSLCLIKDIYTHPVKNVTDIAEYLRYSLEYIDNGPEKQYQDKVWIQKYGFRRGFCIHGVYVEKSTNEHIFHVDELDWSEGTEPNFGQWKSFNGMIEGVSKKYAILWKLE